MRPTRRPGFTLIELLVVIGIILILVAIVVIGLRHVNNTAARHETIAEMKLCSDMLKEYENVSGLVNIEGIANTPNPLTLPPPWGTDGHRSATILPVYLDPGNGVATETVGTQPQSALVEADFAGSMSDRDMGDKTATARYSAHAVQWTQSVMYLLLRDPKNRITISSVPAKRVLETWQNVDPSAKTIDAAVVLDGWGNPIVFVPRGGLHIVVYNAGVSSKGLQEFVVRSSGINLAGLPLNANDHPFFASAGQDGVFTDAQGGTVDYASDNVYSFQD